MSLSRTFPLQAVPKDVDFNLMCRAAVRARGIGLHAVARPPGRCSQRPGHEAAQQ